MADTGPLSFCVVCEDEPDRHLATTIVDRVLCEAVTWVEPEVLAALREWRGLSRADDYLKIHSVPKLARERGLRVSGHFGGKPGEPMARVVRTALVMLTVAPDPPDLAVVVVDSDDQLERAAGLQQAKGDRNWPFPVVVGLPHTKRECWIIPGFVCGNDEERALLDHMRRELGFDPTLHADRLRAKHDDAKLSAKRVLGALSRGSPQRAAQCYEKAPLDLLDARGLESGLTAFIAQVRSEIAPLLARGPKSS